MMMIMEGLVAFGNHYCMVMKERKKKNKKNKKKVESEDGNSKDHLLA